MDLLQFVLRAEEAVACVATLIDEVDAVAGEATQFDDVLAGAFADGDDAVGLAERLVELALVELTGCLLPLNSEEQLSSFKEMAEKLNCDYDQAEKIQTMLFDIAGSNADRKCAGTGLSLHRIHCGGRSVER